LLFKRVSSFTRVA